MGVRISDITCNWTIFDHVLRQVPNTSQEIRFVFYDHYKLGEGTRHFIFVDKRTIILRNIIKFEN